MICLATGYGSRLFIPLPENAKQIMSMSNSIIFALKIWQCEFIVVNLQCYNHGDLFTTSERG